MADVSLLENCVKGYLYYFDFEIGMLCFKYVDGCFYENFDFEEGKNFELVIGFVEGIVWQYCFYVFYDIFFLIDIFGGRDVFVKVLMACFVDDQYDVANELDIIYLFFYNYVFGVEWCI